MRMQSWKRWLKYAFLNIKEGRVSDIKASRRSATRLLVEVLEDRVVPTLVNTFYVGTSADYAITNDVAPAGLSNGDTVTWNPGAGSTLGASVTGLTYGTNAFGSINAAINAASNGDTIKVGPGTYNERVTVTKSVSLLGNQQGADARTGRVAAPEAIIDGSTLGGAVSVKANNVTVDGFTVQGDSSFTAGLLAGITTKEASINGSPAGTVAGLHIFNDIVQNVPQGMSPGGDLAVIEDNLIRNTIAGQGQFDGFSGLDSDRGLTNALIDNNKFVNNAQYSIHIIGFNGNTPVTTSGNTVSNNQMDSELDLSDNTNAQIIGNRIVNSPTGGITLGEGDNGITIMNNEVSLNAASAQQGGFGAFRVKDYSGGFAPNSNVTVTGNKFLGGTFGYGMHVDAGTFTGTLVLSLNQFAGGLAAIQNDDPALNIDASAVYWGTTSEASVSSTIQGAGAAKVDFTPLLNNNESLANQNVVGFQPDTSSLTVHTAGAQTGVTGRITEAIGLVAALGTVVIHPGTYAENVNVNKATTLAGTATINGTLALSAAGAILSPGITPAIGSLTTGSVTFAANTAFTVSINGPNSTSYDQLIASGVTLSNAQLNVNLNYTPAPTDSFTLIKNTGTQNINGTFQGLPEGQQLQINGYTFQITYHGGAAQRDIVLMNIDSTVQQLQMSYTQGQLTVPLSPSASYGVTVAGNRAFFLHGDLALTTTGNYYQNAYGQQEKWVTGITNQFHNPWYFILPSGSFFAWNGTSAAAGAFLATLPPFFYYHPELLTTNPSAEHLAFILKQTLGLSFTHINLDQNSGGAGERWVRSTGGNWYFILPNGQFYAWDGTANQASGTFLAQLTPDYYTEFLARVVNAQPNSTLNQYSASIQNSNSLVVSSANAFIGEFFARLIATQGQTVTETIYRIQVTNSPPQLTHTNDVTYPTAQGSQMVGLSATDPDTGDTVTYSALAGNAGYILGQRYGLNKDPSGYFFNSFGQNEVWFRGLNKAWYFIKANGQFFVWDGKSNLATSTLLYTVDPVFWDKPNLMIAGQPQDLAFTVKQTFGLSLQGGLHQNYGGQNEKWFFGTVDNNWYFIKPDGTFYRWDGQANQATGTLLATFSSSYWTTPTRLYQAAPNQIGVGVSGSQLTISNQANFIGTFWVLVSASDGKQSSLDIFNVNVTP